MDQHIAVPSDGDIKPPGQLPMPLESLHSPDRKRPSSATESGPAGTDGQRRAKRGKYTAVACDDCKKRKLKCRAVEGQQACERCIASGLTETCVFAPGPVQATKEKEKSEKHMSPRLDRSKEPKPDGLPQDPETGNREQIQMLNDDVSFLRQQVSSLAETIRDLKSVASPTSSSFQHTASHVPHYQHHHQDARSTQSPSSHRSEVPKQPQFVGPTRSAFSFIIGERSLTRMGIPTFGSPPPTSTGCQSPATTTVLPAAREMPRTTTTEADFWERCNANELIRLLAVFQEEVESVYPFIEIEKLAGKAHHVLAFIEAMLTGNGKGESKGEVSMKDIEIVKVAVATAIVVEAHGKTELSTAMVESVERNVVRISRPEVSIKEIQLMTMLSTYYFHSDDELLAWRSIGVAAREALEMGLHREKSLLENFPDARKRRLAIRVFWCVYVLDRRWSFGTSLPFALNDRDIDPNLPQPDSEFSYLKCMVGYGNLCSKLWEAIPPFGSPSHSIPDETVSALDLHTQEWLDSIPPDLQLRHPRLGLAPRSQPRVLHRLRALLYLRGNHIRTLIYRHHLHSSSSIAANLRSAWLVVDIAQDSIQVLCHLNATTDIYTRQQNVFNYFLLSALAVIFLAVCHAPEMFTGTCRKSFLDAVELVRVFSKDSIISRRLWESIRGLLPRLRRLGLEEDGDEGTRSLDDSAHVTSPAARIVRKQQQQQQQQQRELRTATPSSVPLAGTTTELLQGGQDDLSNVAMPDIYQMRNELLTLFDAFGQGQGQRVPMQQGQQVMAQQQQQPQQSPHPQQQQQQQGQLNPVAQPGSVATYTNGDGVEYYRDDGIDMGIGEAWEFSRRFQGLI